MLKNIDPLLSGALLHLLDDMGHGDVLVLADRNFPAYAQGVPVIRLDVDAAAALEAILTVFPLDTFVESPIARMGPQDAPDEVNARQDELLALAARHHGSPLVYEAIPRMSFYDRAAEGFAVVQTLETAPYCDFLLTKGVI